jgi:NAD(P)-dependent dehydrogenase (short-subunit alcohol dehydrogenase family)
MPHAHSPLPFTDRHVVVTGGTGALGSAVVAELVEQGAFCYVPARSHASAARFRLAQHPRVELVEGVDLTDEKATRAFYDLPPALWASIHLAGGFSMAPLAETSLRDFESLFDLNAKTCFLCCREAVRRIRATRAHAGGRLVNVAARPALVPTGGLAVYAASKAAVAALTASLAEELAPERIWVNAIVPSIIDTPANRQAMPAAEYERWARPDEIARTIAALAAPDNLTVRGGLVPVYGRT